MPIAGQPQRADPSPGRHRTAPEGDAMNFLDSFVMSHLNVFARKSWLFDQAVAFLSVNYLLKGGVLMALVWWAWFSRDDRASKDREHLVATILSCAVALVVGRMMVLVLPFRVRPLHE